MTRLRFSASAAAFPRLGPSMRSPDARAYWTLWLVRPRPSVVPRSRDAALLELDAHVVAARMLRRLPCADAQVRRDAQCVAVVRPQDADVDEVVVKHGRDDVGAVVQVRDER